MRSCRYDIPLGGSSGPSVWVLGGNPQGLSPFQFLLCFDPIWDVVRQHFFISFFRVSFLHSIQSSDSSSWLDVLSVSFSNEVLLSWPYSSFVFSSSCVSSLISSSWVYFPPKSSLFFVFSHCLNDETKHSALGCAEHFFVFF